MPRLEYRLGNINIDQSRFEYSGEDPKESAHKFLVVGNGKSISLFIGPKGHVGIVKSNRIDSTRVLGGGSVYINREGYLVLDSLSHVYGAVPSDVACEFARLIQEELKKMGLKKRRAIVKPKKDLSERWKQYGYEEEPGLGSKLR